MFPYAERPFIEIGGTTLHAFGLLVALAVIVGCWLVLRRTERLGLSRRRTTDLLLWTLGIGFLISHLDYLAFSEPQLFFNPSTILTHPLRWLNLWNGMSAFGGILGGTLGAALYMWRHRWDSAERWLFLESMAYSFPFAWAIARFGCYLAHDHPGIHTSSWLAVQYPGGARYDLGLFDCFLAIAIAFAFSRLDRVPRPSAFFITAFLLIYGPARLLLDNLRIEGRVAGLMAGQWGALVAIALGLFTLRILLKGPMHPAPQHSAAEPSAKWQMEYLAGD